MTASTAWAHYLTAKRNASKASCPLARQKWEFEAAARLVSYFAAVDLDSFAMNPRPWVWRDEPDHRPIDPRKWRAKRKAQH